MGKICYEVHTFQNGLSSFTLHKNASSKGTSFYSNYHSEIEIIYTIAGSETICVEEDSYVTKPGDITVINSGKIHAGVSENWRHHVLIPSNDFLDGFGIRLSRFSFTPQIRDENLKNLFLEIVRESDCTGEYRDAMTRIAVERFLIVLLRDYGSIRTASFAKTASGSEYGITTKVMDYLAAHFFENFPIDQISESIGITTPYMCHCVKQVTGKSIVDHLNLIRCRAAYHYLIHSDKKINEIATLCGFNGRSYFAKVYRQTMGILPSEVNRTPFENKE